MPTRVLQHLLYLTAQVMLLLRLYASERAQPTCQFNHVQITAGDVPLIEALLIRTKPFQNLEYMPTSTSLLNTEMSGNGMGDIQVVQMPQLIICALFGKEKASQGLQVVSSQSC